MGELSAIRTSIRLLRLRCRGDLRDAAVFRWSLKIIGEGTDDVEAKRAERIIPLNAFAVVYPTP